MSERRRDPSDGVAYTFDELAGFYAGTYAKKAIRAYWETECLPVKATAKVKAKAKAKVKKEPKAKSMEDKEEPKATTEEAGAKEPRPQFEDMEATGLCVAGEALIDFLPAKTADGANAYRGVPGGSPFNCCIAAQRLGTPVTFLGALSTDLFGEELCGHLQREGVSMESVVRLERPSTLAFVNRGEGEGENYAFFKENAADRSLTKGAVARALRGHRFCGVHVSLGAVTLEHGPCAQAFQALFRLGGKQRALRSFDPNIRAGMIKGPASKYARRLERMLRGVDLVKTSEEDLAFLYGDAESDNTLNLRELGDKWRKLGPKLVVVTRGAKGAEAFAQDVHLVLESPGERPNTIDAEGQPAPVVDTVGAGDSFMGGLVTGCLATASLLPKLLDGEPWDEPAVTMLRSVLQRAAVTAAVNCSRAGANPPKEAEVSAICAKRSVSSVSPLETTSADGASAPETAHPLWAYSFQA